MTNNQLCLSGKSTIESLNEISDGLLIIFDDDCIRESGSDALKKQLLVNHKTNMVTLFSKSITDAVKRVDSNGYVVENLSRDNYRELCTPLICDVKCLTDYYKKFEYWNLHKFINLHNEKLEFLTV